MSYRELRDATEILRALDYPRLVSIENFRIPNFELMSEILEWVVKKFDPNTRIPKNKETEGDRILFVKTCVLALMQRARLKLNPRNLYMSDGHSVRELMTVLKLLYQTTRNDVSDDKENMQVSVLRNQINAKKLEIRMASQIAAEIPVGGAAIHDLLSKEIFAKEARMRALSQQLNVSEVEKLVRQMIEKATREEAEIEHKLNNIGQDEQNLDTKIDRRKLECEQLQKRLSKLQSYRPPNRDEFERFEDRLKILYQEYVLVYRNLGFMKQQMNEIEIVEQEKSIDAERNMRIAVEKMKMENNGIPPVDIKVEDEDQQKAAHMRVFGNMIGAGLSDDEEDDDDLDDDDDDDDDILDIPSENGEDELELTNGLNNILENPEAEEIENFNPEAQPEMYPDEKQNGSDEDF
uniref:Clusterin-associated protein 1 n=1 Tax=Panagrolaimus sp. ES5 TaxID=591445 RepID=A0AC34FM19_9BILA